MTYSEIMFTFLYIALGLVSFLVTVFYAFALKKGAPKPWLKSAPVTKAYHGTIYLDDAEEDFEPKPIQKQNVYKPSIRTEVRVVNYNKRRPNDIISFS